MADVSAFFDESGDMGTESRYYLLGIVLHDQSAGFRKFEDNYLDDLARSRMPDVPFHMSPLLNGHDAYEQLSVEVRKEYFAKFRIFSEYFPFLYHVFAYEKKEFSGIDRLATVVERDLAAFVRRNLSYFQSFDSVKTYYDNGQSLVTHAIANAMGSPLAHEAIKGRLVSPNEYRLSQLADYVCGVELTALKYASRAQTATDSLFFGTNRDFTRNVLRKLRRKMMV